MALSQESADRDNRTFSERWNVPTLAGASTMALGMVVMSGWALDIPLLRSVLPGNIAMQPITALALIIGGFALIAAARPRPRREVVRLAAASMALLAGVDLAQFLLGADFGVDFLFFPDAVGRATFVQPIPGSGAGPNI